ncbi:HmuY family protein [Porphyromonas endodontalis]
MPPSVRLSGKVFFVKCADGKIARIQFTDCKDKTGRKNGFISFTYDYNVSVK